MHIEFRHLKTIQAIHRAGGLARAADILHITQSALSHQIKGLEDQAGVELFVRRSKPLKLSAAGHRLLRLAEKVLPEIEALEAEFEGVREGSAGRMHIAIECHACFEWLFPVLERFRKTWADVDVDIRPGLAFDALPALQKEEVDLVVSSDPEDLPGVIFKPLFDYEPVFVASSQHPLAAQPFVVAEDFRDELLITYPVDRSRLDVFTELLTPAKVEPRAIRQVELTAVILLLVASNRGVAVLPDWVVREVRTSSDYVTRKVTDAAARISLGLAKSVSLGNLDARRDWGFAGDYVEGMWRMLQQDKADDYVLATGVTTTIRDFFTCAATALGMDLEWTGEGEGETARCRTSGKQVMRVNPKFYRPAEVDLLIGDASKAREKLGWEPRVTVEQLAEMMAKSDYDALA